VAPVAMGHAIVVEGHCRSRDDERHGGDQQQGLGQVPHLFLRFLSLQLTDALLYGNL
jgi:hypothetical protein